MTPPDDDLAAAERRLWGRLYANLDAADKLLKQATKQPTTKGSTGQPKSAPGFEAAEHCDRTAIAICAAIVELRQQRASEDQTQRESMFDPFARVDDAAGIEWPVGSSRSDQ